MNILITGGNSFIGYAIALYLVNHTCHSVRVSIRKSDKKFPYPTEVYENIDLQGNVSWAKLLDNIDVVIHCAAIAHSVGGLSKTVNSSLIDVNVDATTNLAKQAALYGVKRFIFLSTLAIHGSETREFPFCVDDQPKPYSNYAYSKLSAENSLFNISKVYGLSLVVIRPPLVYGLNAPGKFSLLLSFINFRLPLPFYNFHNKRGFVFIDNLVDLIICCIDHPNASNQVFLVSDDDDISINEFVRKIGIALNKPVILFPLYSFIFNIVARIFRKAVFFQYLFGSLRIDIEHTKSTLNWKPPFSVDDAICKIFKN